MRITTISMYVYINVLVLYHCSDHRVVVVVLCVCVCVVVAGLLVGYGVQNNNISIAKDGDEEEGESKRDRLNQPRAPRPRHHPLSREHCVYLRDDLDLGRIHAELQRLMQQRSTISHS